jgi:hypothetical protein
MSWMRRENKFTWSKTWHVDWDLWLEKWLRRLCRKGGKP